MTTLTLSPPCPRSTPAIPTSTTTQHTPVSPTTLPPGIRHTFYRPTGTLYLQSCCIMLAVCTTQIPCEWRHRRRVAQRVIFHFLVPPKTHSWWPEDLELCVDTVCLFVRIHKLPFTHFFLSLSLSLSLISVFVFSSSLFSLIVHPRTPEIQIPRSSSWSHSALSSPVPLFLLSCSRCLAMSAVFKLCVTNRRTSSAGDPFHPRVSNAVISSETTSTQRRGIFNESVVLRVRFDDAPQAAKNHRCENDVNKSGATVTDTYSRERVRTVRHRWKLLLFEIRGNTQRYTQRHGRPTGWKLPR